MNVLLETFKPYFIVIVIIVGFIAIIKSLKNEKYIEIIFAICIISVVVSFVANPEMFERLGDFITSFIAETVKEDLNKLDSKGGVI